MSMQHGDASGEVPLKDYHPEITHMEENNNCKGSGGEYPSGLPWHLK